MGQVRGCLLSVLLPLLLAANGYAIWQIQMLRGEVVGLRKDLAEQRGETRLSMADYARDAAEAFGRGEIARAQADLERLSEMAQEAKQLADERRRQLLDQVQAARDAVAKGEADSRRRLDQIARLLSQERPKSDQNRR